MARHLVRISLLIAYSVLAVACGGGGSGSSSQPPISNPPPTTPPAPTTSSVNLSSDAGDYVGSGGNYYYTKADSLITVTATDAHLSVFVSGNQTWEGEFQLPDSYTRLEVGVYSNLTRYPFHDAAVGGLSWTGEGRLCNNATGTLTINDVVYDGMTLVSIDFEFEQYCNGDTAGLHGDIYWDANDPTTAPGPRVPPPVGLWEPAAGVTPDTGSYIYLESEAGDFIGEGLTYLYTLANAGITVSEFGGRLGVSINGDELWRADFQAMNSIRFIEVGFYGDLQRYPFHNPFKGGLSWSGEGRGCNTLTGWFVVDSVTYEGDTLTAIDLRFEQHCEGGGPALYGEIHWEFDDAAMPPGPVVPPPAGLWEPAAGVTPDTGNFIYLESEPGDFVGGGRDYLYTQADSVIDASTNGAHLIIDVNGDELWSGNFMAMATLIRLEVGYYGDLQRFPFHNPVKGGLDWSGDGRGCNSLDGWFVIDSVTYDGDILQAIDLRFEQHCEGADPALNGAIHWDINDTTAPPGPVVPPPAGLWEPPAGVTPATGNYVYLESETGDWVGQGQNYLYTQADSILTVAMPDARFTITVNGDEGWNGNFVPMNSLADLEVGYYGDVGRFPFHNPVKGGLDWSGEGRGCNSLTGWFVIDSLTRDGDTLTAIDLRFEQRCAGGPALHGEIHWDINDTTAPPGPVVPPPAGLWEPPAGVTPTTGDYVYLESDVGDWIGQGRNYLYTDADSTITISSPGARLDVSVNGAESWTGNFEAMSHLNYLEVGYYGDLQRDPFGNPVKGGLDWFGEGRSCSMASGWFVIDSLTYVGVTLTSISLRFEQRCDGGPPLNGEIHWSQ